MARPAVVVAVAFAFVCAGCLGAAEPGAVGAGWNGDPANPYHDRVLSVSYETPAGDDRNYDPLVHQAMVYWSEQGSGAVGYDVGFRRAEAGETADVHVRFVERVGECGAEDGDHTAGCAPVVETPAQVDRPVDVSVRAGLSNESTVRVLKHELGHVLGLSHGEGPGDVMAARADLTTQPRTDATDRALPWRTDDLHVYLDLAAVDEGDRDDVRRQVGAALHYYMDGAGGTVPSNVTFYRTDDREDAHVVVRATDRDDCRDGPGSCGTVTGDDLDGDGNLDHHDRLTVLLVDLDSEAVAWHVGRWLGRGFGHEEGEFPDPLEEDAGYDQRRSNWWD